MNMHNLVVELVKLPVVNEKGESEGRTTYSYQFAGFLVEKSLTKEERKAKVKPSMVLAEVSKNALSEIFDGLDDFELTLDSAPYKQLVRLADKKVPKMALWVSETQAALDLAEDEAGESFVPTDEVPSYIRNNQEFFRPLLVNLKERFEELKRTISSADPDLDCKKRFIKSGPFKVISISPMLPYAIVEADIDREIEALQALKARAKTISTEDYKAKLEEYFSKNGVDDDGYVMLRNTK